MKRFLFSAFLFLCLFSAQAFGQEQPIGLRDGPGRELVEGNCAICHSLDYPVMNSPFLDRAGWEKTINKMVSVYGAPIKKEDIPKIVDYLTRYYGKKE